MLTFQLTLHTTHAPHNHTGIKNNTRTKEAKIDMTCSKPHMTRVGKSKPTTKACPQHTLHAPHNCTGTKNNTRTMSRGGDIRECGDLMRLKRLKKEVRAIAAELKICDCIIQATSLGLKESDPPPIDLQLLEINKNLVIFDTIYKNTKLLQKAAALGIRCSGGREMLIQQGAESFRLWTNKEPDLDAMRAGFELPPGGVEV